MVAGLGTTHNLPNYTGELFLLGQNTTPFLNLIGGLNGANMPVVNSTEFSMGQGYALNAPSQPEISEEASTTAPEATHYGREQETNVVQIFQKAVKISYSKLGDANTVAGINVLGQEQPVRNEKDFQINANLAQIARDVNYTFLHGTYQKPSNSTTAAKTRGILTGINTKVVNNSAKAELTKDMLDELFRNCATDGFDFTNAVIMADAYNVQKITNLYGYAPTDRNIGGMAIKQLLTDFGQVMIVFEPTMNGTLGLFDMNKIAPVFRNIAGKGAGIFYEDLAKVGAAEHGQLYGEVGLDYSSERFHGKITNLATSPVA
jgi:hypothetical protein